MELLLFITIIYLYYFLDKIFVETVSLTDSFLQCHVVDTNCARCDVQGSHGAHESRSNSARLGGRRRGRGASSSCRRRHRRPSAARVWRRTRARRGACARRCAALLKQPPAHLRVAHSAALGAHLNYSCHLLRGIHLNLRILCNHLLVLVPVVRQYLILLHYIRNSYQLSIIISHRLDSSSTVLCNCETLKALFLAGSVGNCVGGCTIGKRIMGLRVIACSDVFTMPNGLLEIIPATHLGFLRFAFAFCFSILYFVLARVTSHVCALYFHLETVVRLCARLSRTSQCISSFRWV